LLSRYQFSKGYSRFNRRVKKRNELSQKSPQIPKWTFRKACKGITEGEADYKVDERK